MCGSGAGEASCFGFHHGPEIVAAPCALLLQIFADRGEVFFGEGFVEQAARCTGSECRDSQVG